MENLSFMIMFACILVPSIIANDSINVLQSMSDGETLVSKGEIYELGFFSPGRSQKRYLGIWYKNIPIQTVVWVANRENPINDSSGILTVNSTGNLVLTQNGSLVWYTNPHQQALNPVVELLDSGNLVIRNEAETDPEAYLWQSFEHPSDTFLAGMKLGWDLKTYQERKLTAWKSPDDPSPGDVSRVLKLYDYPEFYIMRGEQKLFRFGPWNGIYFSGVPDLKHTIYGLNFVSSKDQNFVRNIDEIYFTYSIPNNSIIVRSVVNETGIIYRYSWWEANKNWAYRTLPEVFCDNYGFCGPYGNCLSAESQVCQCLKGFSPKSQEAWNSSNWSRGCVRNTPLSCKDKLKDGFVKFEGLKVPDTTHTLLDESIGLKECKDKCLNNCSCMAYTNSDIRDGGSGCVIWFGDLIDLKQQTFGQDLYVRMPASELESVYRHKRNTPKIVASTVAAICGVLLLSSYFIYSIRRKYAEKNKSQKDDINLPTFDFSSISRATDHFSQNNKLGQGGFGVVYKGILPNGQEIAVKRLSKTSIQGLEEFKNEVMLIVKLQHRNLVKLFGCSIQQEEKLLIYEFMPNRSLDYIIFDSTRRALLDWTKRFDIINGIARGLLYLHHDSRLKIIHRDLKTSNVLLDSNMNPKISDFGMARIFALDQDEADTDKVVGTYGYIPPEYAAHGSFSTKSDVFSFGVIVLEIISGRKNRRFYDSHHSLNLLGHAWRLWIENRPMELVDDLVDDLPDQFEIIRYIHIGLLCVQHRPQDRPEMSSVILMLNGEKLLPEPSQPGFYTGKDYSNTTASSSRNIDSSDTLEAR